MCKSLSVSLAEQISQIDTFSRNKAFGIAQGAYMGSGVDWGCTMLYHKIFGSGGMQLCYSHSGGTWRVWSFSVSQVPVCESGSLIPWG